MPSRGGLRNKASKGGRGGPPSREEKISKAMSYVLRHAAEREKIKMDEKGYVNVGDLVSFDFINSSSGLKDLLYHSSISLEAVGKTNSFLILSWTKYLFFSSRKSSLNASS